MAQYICNVNDDMKAVSINGVFFFFLGLKSHQRAVFFFPQVYPSFSRVRFPPQSDDCSQMPA